MLHKIAIHEKTLKIKTFVIYISKIYFLLTSNFDIYSFILSLFRLLQRFLVKSTSPYFPLTSNFQLSNKTIWCSSFVLPLLSTQTQTYLYPAILLRLYLHLATTYPD